MTAIQLNEEQILKLQNISRKIKKIYDGSECENLESGCLNNVRQSLEYLCLFTCEVYDIPIVRKNKKGNLMKIDSPTLGDMAPIIEKYFQENNIVWNKEIAVHIGSIWILGNLGSHAQKDLIETGTDISSETVENALNSMYIVTEWFYKHYDMPCPVSVKEKKRISEDEKKLNNKKGELIKKLADIKMKMMNISPQENISQIDESRYEDIYFDELVEAIEVGKCILFIGPDISVDADGQSLHKKFYKGIRKVEYIESEGFFMSKAEKHIGQRAMSYYSNRFDLENIEGKRILDKLAQIPFPLIISVAPDETINKIYDQYNIPHDFYYFKQENEHKTPEPSLQKPIIYNMLGSPARDGNFIFTHKQYYKYLYQKQKVKIPEEIEFKIQDSPYYIFLGINFNQWQNRLLMFALNMYRDADGYGLNSKDIDESNLEFLQKQFNITLIKDNYEDFVDILIRKIKEKIPVKDINQIFIDNTSKEITAISYNENIEIAMKELESIDEKIKHFENILNS